MIVIPFSHPVNWYHDNVVYTARSKIRFIYCNLIFDSFLSLLCAFISKLFPIIKAVSKKRPVNICKCNTLTEYDTSLLECDGVQMGDTSLHMWFDFEPVAFTAVADVFQNGIILVF